MGWFWPAMLGGFSALLRATSVLFFLLVGLLVQVYGTTSGRSSKTLWFDFMLFGERFLSVPAEAAAPKSGAPSCTDRRETQPRDAAFVRDNVQRLLFAARAFCFLG